MLNNDASCVGRNTNEWDKPVCRVAEIEGFIGSCLPHYPLKDLGSDTKPEQFSGNQGLNTLHPPDRLKGNVQPRTGGKQKLELDLTIRADLL